jgi:hypothetical protein
VIVSDLADQAPTLTAIGAVGTAFVAMLRLLSRPDSRWQPLVDELREDNARLRADVEDLRGRLAALGHEA